MKEGATLFCPKCGNPVSRDDNFCASCGHNLKDVKVNITSNSSIKKENTAKVEKTSEHTRVFNPKSLDGIDTTDELKNIIAEVDKKISKNIEEYEKSSVQAKSTARERKLKESPSKNIDIKKESKTSENGYDAVDAKKADKEFLDANRESKPESGMSQKELIRRVQEELKKSNFNESSKKPSDLKVDISTEEIPLDNSINNYERFHSNEDFQNKSSKKFSLREKWKNFINEEDDEFSIFSSIKDDSKKKENARNLEISKSVEDSEKSFENTLSTPKIDIEDAIKKSEEAKRKKKEDKKKDDLSNKPQNIKKKPQEFQNKNKDLAEKSFNDTNINITKEDKSNELNDNSKDLKSKNNSELSEKLNSIKIPKQGETSNSSDKHTINKKNIKPKNLKNLFSFKDNGEKPVKEIESVDSKVDKAIENNLSKKVNDMESKISKSSLDALDKIMEVLSNITDKISNYIGDFGSKESKILIGIGTILNAIALLIGSGSFKFILILFLILKLVFDYLEFYIPLNIATDRDEIDTSYPEVKKFALINWIICKVFLFIGFIITPFGGFLKYNMLQALTAMPLATLILVILSLLIAITLYKEEFVGRSKINFIGWYAIAFTLFELLFKMIWFIINFIFVTLF
ncbi:zinc ribbon domain-containing protein [Peptoniphilus sp.]|uniref:zinc ribbon domain-containing protein n=1 Tax=Peptoniphilus sp. TaxID=1971214 RepID=UPI002A902B20|nr:zinc ribbon domain-containing protein [Peptoniphilus sp.]